MTRVTVAVLGFAFGLALLIGSTSPAPAQVVKKVDPNKKVDPKKPDPKKPEPKKPEPPKPPMVKPPAPAAPDEPLPPAEEPDGLPSPLRLAKGLRDQGLADLSIQLLANLEKDKTLKGDDLTALPLEQAMCKLALAKEAEEEAAKSAFRAEARSLLNTFVNAKSKHPRLAEGRLSLARLTSLEARAQLQRANRSREESLQKTGRLEARKLYTDASKQYTAAAKDLDGVLATMPDSVPKRNLSRDKAQAELDAAVNQYNLYATFPPDGEDTATERQDRSKALTEARKLFEVISTGPANNPNTWIARAWMAEIDTMQQKPEAKALVDELNRVSGGAAEAGKRLMKYFDVRRAFRAASDPKTIADMQILARNWLQRYDSVRKPSDEAIHVKYMLGLSIEGDVRNSMTARLPKGATGVKMPDASQTERTKLKEAEKSFRDVMQTENDYTERATEHRMTVVRLLIGEAIRPAKEYLKFEDAHMAALVAQSKLREKTDKDAAKAARDHLISLLERARILATPGDSAADVSGDQLTLAAMYLGAGRPHEAAVLGEYLARASRPLPSRAASAGELALAAYLTASAQSPPGAAGDDIRKSDRDRALRIGEFVEKTFPTEPATDAIRYRLGFLFFTDGKLVQAYDLLSKIRPGFAYLNQARTMQGLITHQLLTPADSPLPANRRVEVYRKTVADLEGIATPAVEEDSQDVLDYAKLRIRLCMLHLLKDRVEPKAGTALDKVETVAATLLKDLDAFKNLTPEHKMEASLLAQDLLTRSIYLQGAALFKDGKTEELLQKLDPILQDVDKVGAAVSRKISGTDQPLEGTLQKLAAGFDADRRDVVLLALKARIRKGQVSEAKAQLDRLERLGGSIDTNLSTLSQLVNEVRSQIASLKQEKPEEAKALADGLSELIKQITSAPEIKPAVRVFAGQALVAVERYAEAAEELAKVPPVSAAELVTPLAQVPEERRDAVRFFKAAALYRLEALRKSKQFAPADALAAEVVGTKEKKGWGYNNTEYKKEVFLLSEDKAVASPPGKAATKFWSEAVLGWVELANIQKTRLRFSQDKLFELEKAAEIAQLFATLGQVIPWAVEDEAKLAKNAEVLLALNGARADVERNKAVYYDLFFESSRTSIMAFQSVYKGDMEKLKDKYEKEAQKMLTLETQNPDLAVDVRAKYVTLLGMESMKDLKAAYINAMGKMFLQKPDAPITGGQ